MWVRHIKRRDTRTIARRRKRAAPRGWPWAAPTRTELLAFDRWSFPSDSQPFPSDSQPGPRRGKVHRPSAAPCKRRYRHRCRFRAAVSGMPVVLGLARMLFRFRPGNDVSRFKKITCRASRFRKNSGKIGEEKGATGDGCPFDRHGTLGPNVRRSGSVISGRSARRRRWRCGAGRGGARR